LDSSTACQILGMVPARKTGRTGLEILGGQVVARGLVQG
jgi:hypothetical protein